MVCWGRMEGEEMEVRGRGKGVGRWGEMVMLVSGGGGVGRMVGREEWEGLKEGGFRGVRSVGVRYGVKYVVKKEGGEMRDKDCLG